MRIAELARQAGLSTATLRYYEDEGLLRPAGRTEAGYRVYSEGALQRVGFIQRAKALGLTLREIQQLTDEPTVSPSDSISRTVPKATGTGIEFCFSIHDQRGQTF